MLIVGRTPVSGMILGRSILGGMILVELWYWGRDRILLLLEACVVGEEHIECPCWIDICCSRVWVSLEVSVSKTRSFPGSCTINLTKRLEGNKRL